MQHHHEEDRFPRREPHHSSHGPDLKARALTVRREGLSRFIDRAPPLLAALEAAGLKEHGVTPEAVEQILIEDPYWCDHCDGTPAATDRICPQSGKPHRRFLVLVSEALLKLVGEARAVVTSVDATKSAATRDEPGSPAHSAPSSETSVVVRRGVPINPQLMLLAYHAAGRQDSDIDAVHREIACHLVQSLELLKHALVQPRPAHHHAEGDDHDDAHKKSTASAADRDRGFSPAHRQHIGRLVVSFSRAWREYLRVAATIAMASTQATPSSPREVGPLNSPSTPMTPFSRRGFTETTTSGGAQRELVRSAIDTYCALVDLKHQLRVRKDSEEALSQVDGQLEAIEKRIDRIGGVAALEQLQDHLAAPKKSGKSARPARLDSDDVEQSASSGPSPQSSPVVGATDDGSPPLRRIGSRTEHNRPAPLAVGHDQTGASETSPSPPRDDDDSEPCSSDCPCFVPSGGMTPHAPPQMRRSEVINRERRQLPSMTSASESEYIDEGKHAGAAAATAAASSAAASSAPDAEGGPTAAPAAESTDSTASVSAKAAAAARFVVQRTTPMGPGLPPNWKVGRDGRSHPPPKPSPADIAKERRAQLEFRVQASYKARLGLKQVAARQPTAEEAADRNIVSQIEGNMWTVFRQELMETPPNLSRVPQLLNIVSEGLTEALPKRLRARVSQEIRDALDWQTVHRAGPASLHDTRAVGNILSYVAEKVIEYGAAAVEDQVRDSATETKDKLRNVVEDGSSQDVIADATIDAFKWMVNAVRDLHKAITQFGMAFISPELAKGAVESATEFTRDWMAPPAEWASSQQWLRTTAALAHAAGVVPLRPGQAPSMADLECIVAHGILGLCASAKKSLEHRWDDFPSEVLRFERPSIFASSNTLQFCALRLMITNTAMLLTSQPNRRLPGNKPRLPREAVQTLVGKLDDHLRIWLGMAPGDNDKKLLSLDKLKDEVVADVNHGIIDHYSDAIANRTVAVLDVALTEAETRTLQNVIDKVSHTNSNEYIAFEGRLVGAVQQALVATLREQYASPAAAAGGGGSDDDSSSLSSSSSGPKPSPFERLGVVASDLEDLTDDLAAIVQLNVEVHGNTYLKFLTQ